MSGRPLRLVIGLAAAALLGGCQEKLTTPADCPALCPSSQTTARDTVLEAAFAGDTSFPGYTARGAGSSVLASRLPTDEERAIITFLGRDSTVIVKDTARAYSVDSVTLNLGLTGRDTAVKALRLLVYNLPFVADSTTSFATVDAALVPGNLIDSIAVVDTVRAGLLRLTLAGPALARIALPAGNAGRLSIAVVPNAAAPTGVRLGSTSATGGLTPTFTTYAHAAIADTALQRQQILRGGVFTSFVSAAPPPAPDISLLALGGAPSSRVLIRFALPPVIRDTARIVRATLELIPSGPIAGLPNDPAVVNVLPVLADLGQKSPTPTSPSAAVSVRAGSTDTVRVDVVRLAALWQGSFRRPSVLYLTLLPEAGSFSRPVFYSTRSATGHPRLRITYQLPYPFEKP